MNEEEEIKKRLLHQKLQENAQAHMQSQMQQQQMEEALKPLMHQILDPAARERLANLKMVKPELALQLQAYLVQLHQTGQMKGKVTEQQLISILQKLSASERKEFRIKRK